MKSIFGVLFVTLLALTGGLYFTMRPIEKRMSDWQRVKNVPTAIRHSLRQWFATHVIASTPTDRAASPC